MRPLEDPEVAAWLRKADGDARMALLAMGADPPLWDQVCFHSQQAAEKQLKALLVALGRTVPRTHDLVQVIDSLVEDCPALEELVEEAAELSQYGVNARYPGFLFAETEQEGKGALDAARRIMAAVDKMFEPAPS